MSNYCNHFDDVFMGFDDGTFVGLDKTIDHIAKTGTSGLVDTYTIYFTDDTTFEYQITNGLDGDSPEIVVSEITGGHRVTITDRSGTDTVDIMDGIDGDSPEISVSEIAGGHRLTITDITGTRTVDVIDGVDGEDGDSPTVSVSQITGGHRLTITDKNGTRTVDVLDGVKGDKGDTGDDGVSPTISIATITGGHRVSVTDKEGTQSFDVLDGSDIQSVAKTASQGLVDTYTITLTDGTTHTFEVHNGTASIDPTLSISERAADAKVTGDRLTVAESDIEYGINGILEGTYRDRTIGKELAWEDGGISGTGAINSNAYSIRTGYIEFTETQIAVIDPHTAYRCAFYAYDRETDAFIEQANKTDISQESMFYLNPAYKYRIVLYNTALDVRAVPDNFAMYDTHIREIVPIQAVSDELDYTADAIVDDKYRKRFLGSQIAWENGGLNASGEPTGSEASIRTAEFIEFEGDTLAVVDPVSADLYFNVVAYNKTTGAYIEQSYIRGITSEKQISVNPQYKYKIYVTDATATPSRPSAENLVWYECRDMVEKRKAEVAEILANRGGFAKRKPLVTIVDDDGYTEFYTRLFDANGTYLLHAPICTAYEGIMLGSSNFMNVSQLKAVEAAGCEILGHGATPLAPKTLDPEVDPITIEEAEADVIANLKPMLNAGFSPVGYVYPSGSTNVEVREMLSKYYAYAMTTIRHLPSSSPDYDKLHNFGCVAHYAINRVPLQDANNALRSWAEIESIVEDAVDDNGWLILYTHFKKDTGGTITATSLNAIIDAIEQAGAEVVTATEAFKIFRNAWQSGDYLGKWNQVNSWGIEYEDHTSADAGSAVNQLGDTDLKLNLSPAETEGY